MNSKNPDQGVHIEVDKDFEVSSDRVFEAWLDPEMLSRWMFGQEVRDEEIVGLENKPSEGGTFSYKVLRNGKVPDHRGTYRLIERPDRLDFTWGVDAEAGDESVVSVRIDSTDAGCRLTLVHKMDPEWDEYKERTKEGWNYMPGRLNEVFEHHK